MQELPRGGMLAVSLPAEEAKGLLNGSLSLAAANTNRLCTVSGPDAALAALEQVLLGRGVTCRRISTSHAFHSAMMDPVLESFSKSLQRIRLSPPCLPFLSNLTGTWIRPEEACDPAYWTLHLRRTVRFADGLRELLNDSARMLLEVGPGQTLSNFARGGSRPLRFVWKSFPAFHTGTTRNPHHVSALQTLLVSLYWAGGAAVDWEGFHRGETLHRVQLPTYPFERKRYYVEPKPAEPRQPDLLQRKPDVDDWFYVPSWKRSVPSLLNLKCQTIFLPGSWILFLDELGLGVHVQEVLATRAKRFIAIVQLRQRGV